MDDIRDISLNELVRRLHESISGFVAGMENVISMNRQPQTDEISELRDHIVERLRGGEQITDNRKVIGLLDLLSRDQAVLELVRDDAKDWLEIVEAIEGHMLSKKPLTGTEQKEVRQIKRMAGELKALIRA
jgi:hypothetical protein